jgi:integrase/recombinase XerD
MAKIPIPRFRELGAGTPEPPAIADLVWQRVEEFLRSRELSANTRKAYQRQLQQF